MLPGERMAEYDEIRKRTGGSIDGAELARLQNAIEPWDIDFRTVGEFYHKIESAFARIPEERFLSATPPRRPIRRTSISPRSSSGSWMLRRRAKRSK